MISIVRLHHNSYTDITVETESQEYHDVVQRAREEYDTISSEARGRAFLETQEETGAEVVSRSAVDENRDRMEMRFVAGGWALPHPRTPEGVETDDEEDYEESQ